jgi:predicted transcriptional regulator
MAKGRSISIRVDDETYKKIEKIAKEEDRSLAAQARRLVRLGLKGE